jgi:DnaJ-domain-containing protein 1
VIPYFILGFALLAGLLLMAKWFVAAEPRQVAKVARWGLVLLAVVLALVFVIAGRHFLLAFLLPLLIPILRARMLRMLWLRAKAAAGPRKGQTSQVETRFLRMELDHDSGDMNGEVLEGAFAGRRLGNLDRAELIALWREVRAGDEESRAVLEAYLDRHQGEGWREEAGAGAGEEGGAASSASEAMSKEEAYGILGLEPGASESEIREAHRRLMLKVHPDHGGSNYLAAKINRAKELLLDE